MHSIQSQVQSQINQLATIYPAYPSRNLIEFVLNDTHIPKIFILT